MKAIFVKYIPATNTKPSRLKAFDGDGNMVTVSKANSTSREAAEALVSKMGWGGHLVKGGHKNIDAFCFLESSVVLLESLKALRAGKRDGATMGDASRALDLLCEDLGIKG